MVDKPQTRTAKYKGRQGHFYMFVDEAGQTHFLAPQQVNRLLRQAIEKFPDEQKDVVLIYLTDRKSGLWYAS